MVKSRRKIKNNSSRKKKGGALCDLVDAMNWFESEYNILGNALIKPTGVNIIIIRKTRPGFFGDTLSDEDIGKLKTLLSCYTEQKSDRRAKSAQVKKAKMILAQAATQEKYEDPNVRINALNGFWAKLQAFVDDATLTQWNAAREQEHAKARSGALASISVKGSDNEKEFLRLVRNQAWRNYSINKQRNNKATWIKNNPPHTPKCPPECKATLTEGAVTLENFINGTGMDTAEKELRDDELAKVYIEKYNSLGGKNLSTEDAKKKVISGGKSRKGKKTSRKGKKASRKVRKSKKSKK